MANTYSQIHLQFVFAVYKRHSFIPQAHKTELHKYITGIVKRHSQKLLAINCMPDHIHLFIGARPTLYIPDFIKDIKTGATHFINENKWCTGHFGWQEGYGVFSYTYSDVQKIIHYVLNQEEHHRKTIFREEYHALLKEFQIDFDERYVFEYYEQGVNT